MPFLVHGIDFSTLEQSCAVKQAIYFLCNPMSFLGKLEWEGGKSRIMTEAALEFTEF